MNVKRVYTTILACALALTCTIFPAKAVESPDGAIMPMQELECTVLAAPVESLQNDFGPARAFTRVDISIPAKTSSGRDKSFHLEAGEVVRINCSYSPESASIDFGLIAPDGAFYYVNVTDGSINKSIQVDETGDYTLAVRNNSSETVSVVGFVHY